MLQPGSRALVEATPGTFGTSLLFGAATFDHSWGCCLDRFSMGLAPFSKSSLMMFYDFTFFPTMSFCWFLMHLCKDVCLPFHVFCWISCSRTDLAKPSKFFLLQLHFRKYLLMIFMNLCDTCFRNEFRSIVASFLLSFSIPSASNSMFYGDWSLNWVFEFISIGFWTNMHSQ